MGGWAGDLEKVHISSRTGKAGQYSLDFRDKKNMIGTGLVQTEDKARR
jgi:hypothetical protein